MMKCICGGNLKSANTFSGKEAIEEKRNYIKEIDISKIDPNKLIIRSRKCENCGLYWMSVEILDRPVKVRQNMRNTLADKFRKD